MKRILTVLLLSAALTGCRCSGVDQKKEKIAFKLNWSIYGEHAPFFVAQEMGYFAQEGLEVNIITGNGSSATVKTVSEGSIPMGYADATTLIKQHAVGQEAKSVAVFVQASPMAFIYRGEDPVKSWKDIRGKRIGLTVSDASSALFKIILGKLKYKENDVQLVRIATPHAREKALVQKRVDGFFGYYINEPHRLHQKYEKNFGWLRVSDLGIDLLSSAIVVNPEFLSKNEELVKKFVRASQKGLEYSRKNPREAAKILLKQTDELHEDTAVKMIESFVKLNRPQDKNDKILGWTEDRAWHDSIKFLKDHYQFRGKQDPKVYYTNDFLSDIK